MSYQRVHTNRTNTKRREPIDGNIERRVKTIEKRVNEIAVEQRKIIETVALSDARVLPL